MNFQIKNHGTTKYRDKYLIAHPQNLWQSNAYFAFAQNISFGEEISSATSPKIPRLP